MDNDERLARQLQDEEDAAAAAASRALAALHVRGSGAPRDAFIAQTEDAVRKAAAHEDELAQAMALSCMDLAAMQAEAADAADLSAQLGEAPPLAAEDALALALLDWFKRSFFSWVDAPQCDFCGASKTSASGTVGPNEDEREHLASRVEIFRCAACPGKTRFPRFNDPVKLLETRRGRCGEWANCFALCCRATGLDSRLVVDWTDHVWVEYYSATMQRWVHLDPCEAAADTPLLYEGGWGKRLSYCIAVGRDGVADVTQRYVLDWAQALLRRELDETWVTNYLLRVSARLREGLAPAERRALEERDAADAAAMAAAGSRPPTIALPGRQTGSAQWVASRGEGGEAQVSAVAPTPAPAKATRYQRARDGHLAGSGGGRVCGGAVRASGENAPGEVAACVTDGNAATKWLDFGHAGAWVEYRTVPPQSSVDVARYALTSANDAPERDPAHWALERYDELQGEWIVMDEQRRVRFAGRGQRLEFVVGQQRRAAAGRVRLRIVSVADPAAANSVQLACWDLYVSV